MGQTPTQAQAPQAPKGKKTWAVIAGVVIVIIVIVAGLYFAGYLGGQTSGSPVSITETTVGTCSSSSDCYFDPQNKAITANNKVTWTNHGTQSHSVTACDTAYGPSATACPTMNTSPGGFDSGAAGFGGGQTFSWTFSQAGTYYYYCRIHEFMHATVTVS